MPASVRVLRPMHSQRTCVQKAKDDVIQGGVRRAKPENRRDAMRLTSHEERNDCPTSRVSSPLTPSCPVWCRKYKPRLHVWPENFRPACVKSAPVLCRWPGQTIRPVRAADAKKPGKLTMD